MDNITKMMKQQIADFEEKWAQEQEQRGAIPLTEEMKDEIDAFKADLKKEEEEIPEVTIAALHTGSRGLKKAKRARDTLAHHAPYGSKENIASLPIKIVSNIPKNVMFAVDNEGNSVFEINTKTMDIKTV